MKIDRLSLFTFPRRLRFPLPWILAPVFFAFLTLQIHALDEEIVIGRENGWGRVRYDHTMQEHRGFQGYSDILLSDAAYEPDDATDLLLHFDSPSPEPSLLVSSADTTGRIRWENPARYSLNPANIEAENRLRVFGSGAALFSGKESRLNLSAGPGSLFFPGTDWRDFTFEFWLYPAETESVQQLLFWEGVTLPGEWGTTSRTQNIRCTMGSNRLIWQFTNLFRPPMQQEFSLELKGQRELLPRQWHHHMVRFSAETGLLEYLIDGIMEDFAYANSENRETGVVFTPLTGSASRRDLSIGTGLEGVMDELRISSVFRSNIPPAPYQDRQGTAIIGPLDLEHAASRLVSVKSSFSTPGDSDIFFYYALNQTPFAMAIDDAGWIPFTPGGIFSPETRGRYLHLMAALYPDGMEQYSPVLSDISVVYTPDLPPSPPGKVTALPQDGGVHLSWESVPDPDVQGYKIYYGTSPGRYFGNDAAEGSSPVDAGNTTEMTLTGLTNGRLYYFTVVAYDNSPRPFQTLFSMEVSARPRRLSSDSGGGM